MPPMGMGMPLMGAPVMGTAPMGSFCPPSAGTVAIVGDPIKVDEWSEYTDDATGDMYYYNPAKPDETTWEKPKDFDKKKNAGKPAPPKKPEEKKQPQQKKKGKYESDRKGWL